MIHCIEIEIFSILTECMELCFEATKKQIETNQRFTTLIYEIKGKKPNSFIYLFDKKKHLQHALTLVVLVARLVPNSQVYTYLWCDVACNRNELSKAQEPEKVPRNERDANGSKHFYFRSKQRTHKQSAFKKKTTHKRNSVRGTANASSQRIKCVLRMSSRGHTFWNCVHECECKSWLLQVCHSKTSTLVVPKCTATVSVSNWYHQCQSIAMRNAPTIFGFTLARFGPVFFFLHLSTFLNIFVGHPIETRKLSSFVAVDMAYGTCACV